MSRSLPSLAKLSPPRLPKIIERVRLYKDLDRAREKPIVWITAPPGMGKTTLAASYLKARKLKTLWYQVDEGDADPATFFHYLRLACQKFSPRHKTPLPHLTPEYLPGISIFTCRFFEQLYQRMKTPAILVLDNYHLLKQADLIHDLIKVGLDIIPEGNQVLVLSRQPPPPPFARFLATQIIHIIQEDTLRLTTQEINGLIALKQGKTEKGLPRKMAQDLYPQTRGWITGAILMLEHGTSPASTPDGTAAMPEVIFNYLAQEVMKILPLETQEVLLQTAFAPSFTTSLSEALTHNPGAPSIIEDLFRRRYFIEQRGEPPFTYQFHPLFQLFLQSLARTNLTSHALHELQQRTARLLGQHDKTEEAITLFLQTKSWGEAENLVVHQAPLLLAQGRSHPVEKWIRQFPDTILAKFPWLQYWMSQSLRMHNLNEAEEWSLRAFHEFESQQDIDGQLSAWCALVETIQLSWGNWSLLESWMKKLSQLIETIPDFPTTQLHAQVTFNMYSLGSIYDSPYINLPRWTTLALKMMRIYPDLLAKLPSGFLIPLLFIVFGEVKKGSEILFQMKEHAPLRKNPPLTQLSIWYAEAHILWLKGNREQAEHLIDQAIAYGQETGCIVQEIPFTFLRFWVEWLDYDFVAMQKTLSALELCISPTQFRLNTVHFNLAAGVLHFLKGDTIRAHEYFFPVMKNGAIPFIITTGYSHGFAAQIAYAQGDIQLAKTHLQRVAKLGKSRMNFHFLFFASGTRALWALDQKDEATARACLEESLPLIRDQGLQFLHNWPKPKFSLLCAKALEWGIEVEFVQNLVRKYHLIPEQPPLTNLNWPWTLRIKTLGGFAVETDGQLLTFAKKTPRRVLTLLNALIAFGGKGVPETTLSDALWPDADGDLAHQTFATTLHRLRKLLGSDDSLLLKDGKLTLNPYLCWVDTWALEDHVANTDKSAKEQLLANMVHLLDLYQGPFLPDAQDEPWTFHSRERLQGKFIRAMCQLSSALSKGPFQEEAALLLGKAIEREPLAETLNHHLATILKQLNRPAEFTE